MLTNFLIVLAFFWLLFATVYDIKKREVPDWLNFSLIIFALGARFFYDIFNLTKFSINFVYVLLLVILVLALVFFSLVGSFNTKKKESFSRFSTLLFFIILIYLSYADFFSKAILESGLISLYQGIFGLAVFFVLANLLYYGRFFAGGDAKLMMAIGPIIPFYSSILENLNLFLTFFILFLIAGATYGIFASMYFGIKNYGLLKRGFVKNLNSNKNFVYPLLGLGAVMILLGILNGVFVWFGIALIFLPIFYIYLRTLDKSVFVQKVNPSMLTEGDWLYEDVKVMRGKIIKATWDGLTKKEISILKKGKKSVLIKVGIPYAIVFLISFVLLVYFYFAGLDAETFLWNSLR